MHDIIKIIVDENHYLRCPVDTIARDGEGNVAQLEITFPEKLSSYWVYVDFKMPNGEKFKSPRLDVEGNKATYTVPPYVLVEGKLKMQVLFQNESGAIWKSYKKPFTVRPSINAEEDIPDKEDFIAEAQKVLDGMRGAIRCDAAQELNTVQQSTARKNIGAIGAPLIVEITENENGTFSASHAATAVYNAVNTYGRAVYCKLRGNILRLASPATVAAAKFFGFDGKNCVTVSLPLIPTGKATVEEWTLEGGGGSNITVDAELNPESENPVQNKVIWTRFQGHDGDVYIAKETADNAKSTADNALKTANSAGSQAYTTMCKVDYELIPQLNELKSRMDSVEASVGDISAVFDELHAYAQNLVNGGDAE